MPDKTVKNVKKRISANKTPTLSLSYFFHHPLSLYIINPSFILLCHLPQNPSLSAPSSSSSSNIMEIQKQLLRFRHHIIGALLVCLTVFSFLRLAPRFLNVLAYFWPLFLSTALFLVLVLFFAKTQTSHSADAASLPKPAEELLDFVAGHHPDPPLDAHKSD